MTATTANAHKFALDHKRAEHFIVPADSLIIIGLDTEHVQGQHALWRADARAEPNAALVDSVRKHGFIQPVRARKIERGNYNEAEVVVGRERVKVARVLGIPVPCLLWPMGTPDAEIIGAANAENYMRKTETVLQQAEHVYMQLRAEGYFDGVDEKTCMANVSVSTGFNAQRQRNLLAYREDTRLHVVGGEAALAIATLPKDQREAQIAIVIADPSRGTVVEVRERVAYSKATAAAAKPVKPAKVHNGVSKDDAPTGRSIHAAAEEAPTGPKTPYPGLSKPLQRRIVVAQMALSPDERDVEQLVIKVLKVTAGLASPNTVPGFAKIMKDMGFT